MEKRKRKLIDRILMVATPTLVILLITYWVSTMRTQRVFYIPADFEGWVSIKYSIPGAPPLPSSDSAQEITIPPSGTLLTSSPLEQGWGRDTYFRLNADQSLTLIPNFLEDGDSLRRYIIDQGQYYFSHESILPDLPIPTDTVMWDGSTIKKEQEGRVDYRVGELSLEYFYVSKTPKSLAFFPPPHPNDESLERKESGYLEPNEN
ncbi:MAG: hypothetical protein AAF388_05675 [Bacteroidota bacterium]